MSSQDRNIAGNAETPISLHTMSESISSAASDLKQRRTVVSKARDCFIEVLHRDADPSIWIVRRWKRILWFKKRISSDWFISRQQAFAYANEMKKDHERPQGKSFTLS